MRGEDDEGSAGAGAASTTRVEERDGEDIVERRVEVTSAKSVDGWHRDRFRSFRRVRIADPTELTGHFKDTKEGGGTNKKEAEKGEQQVKQEEEQRKKRYAGVSCHVRIVSLVMYRF